MRLHPRPGYGRKVPGLLAVIAAIALLPGCGLGPASPSDPPPARVPSAAPAALSLGSATMVPQVHIPGTLNVVAGTASRFIIVSDLADDRGRYTPDNGRTWEDLPKEISVRHGEYPGAGPAFGSHIGYQGSFAGVVQGPEPTYGYTGLQRWDPATGEVTSYPYNLDTEPDGDSDTALYPVDYVGTAIVLSDGRIFRLSGEKAILLSPKFAATPKTRGLESRLTKDGVTVVQAGYSVSGDYGYLNIAPADGGEGARAHRIPGLLSMDVSAFTIHYLVGTSTALRVCKANVETPTRANCTTLASGDYRRSRYTARLTTSMGADQVYLQRRGGDRVRQWLLREGKVTRVAEDATSWQWLPFRDTDEPMAVVASGNDHVMMASTVNRNGRATPLFAAPAVPAPAAGVALSTGRITYQQDRYSVSTGTLRSVWTRTFTDGVLGAEQKLTDRRLQGLFASGARTATQLDRAYNDGDHTVEFYDGHAVTGRFPAGGVVWLTGISGPYALVGQDVVRADGHSYDTGPVLALFGSLIVEASSAEVSPDRTFRVLDLERPDAAPVALELPRPAGRIYRNDAWAARGDWVVAGYIEGEEYGQTAFNYRTGTSVDILDDAYVTGLGDGWVLVVTGPLGELRLLTTGGILQITDQGAAGLVTDGDRTIAWEDQAGTSLAEITGLPATPPRLLGTLAPTRLTLRGDAWEPQFDLTKAAAAGVLELRDPAGGLVRALPTPSTPDGSIRGVRWDGTDANGVAVAPGVYTWTLVVAAADGSGATTSVDGLRPPSGTVTVTG